MPRPRLARCKDPNIFARFEVSAHRSHVTRVDLDNEFLTDRFRLAPKRLISIFDPIDAYVRSHAFRSIASNYLLLDNDFKLRI
jgi:hypothetical protein